MRPVLRVAPVLILATCLLLASLALPAVAGAAAPICGGKRATKVGTARSERILGTPRADVIFAGAGNDIVIGGGGNDIICGAGGNDTLTGSAGNDRLIGGIGADRLYGSLGIDTCQDIRSSTFSSCERPTAKLTVATDGSGRVTSAPLGIQCGLGLSDCTELFGPTRIGTIVKLTASPGAGQRFSGWVGCPSSILATCTARMHVSRTIRAVFAPIPTHALTASVEGGAHGSITSSPVGIGCPSVCSASFAEGTSVTLTATTLNDAVFSGWGGACSGTNATCTVTMSEARSVSASFTPRYTLSVSNPVAAAGTVTDASGGISCHTDCEERYLSGTQVTLTATANAGFTFSGWSGAGCSGTGTCTVTMSEARSVTASFTQNSYELTVAIDGNGSGGVSGTGISCPGDCTHTFLHGTSVTLTASPGVGSTFAGWSGGGCSGTAPCTTTITSARTVTATFTLRTYTVNVSRSGTGTGWVTSNPMGINCGATCSAVYDHGTQLTLYASPDASSTFAGWSGGGCAGTGTCTITVTSNVSLNAAFAIRTWQLSVTKSGSGTGTVSSTPSGINCGPFCTASFNHGASVTLEALPGLDDEFVGWGGACAVYDYDYQCTVSMVQARSVTAAFEPIP